MKLPVQAPGAGWHASSRSSPPPGSVAPSDTITDGCSGNNAFCYCPTLDDYACCTKVNGRVSCAPDPTSGTYCLCGLSH
jgi:hypothetical protein